MDGVLPENCAVSCLPFSGFTLSRQWVVCCRKTARSLVFRLPVSLFQNNLADDAYTERSCNHSTHFLSYHAVSATSEGIFTCFFTDAADFYDLIQEKEYCATIRSTLSGII